jgi:hypothetical protein
MSRLKELPLPEAEFSLALKFAFAPPSRGGYDRGVVVCVCAGVIADYESGIFLPSP